MKLIALILILGILFAGCGVPIQKGENPDKDDPQKVDKTKVRVAYLWVAAMTTVLYIYIATSQ